MPLASSALLLRRLFVPPSVCGLGRRDERPETHSFTGLLWNPRPPPPPPPPPLDVTVSLHFIFGSLKIGKKKKKKSSTRPIRFIPKDNSLSLLPSPCRHLLRLFIINCSFFFFLFSPTHARTLPSFSPPPSRTPPFPSSACPTPTEGCLNRWLLAGCCCALLVGLQETAYLSA